jgi:hypothetical protein
MSDQKGRAIAGAAILGRTVGALFLYSPTWASYVRIILNERLYQVTDAETDQHDGKRTLHR